MHRSTGFDSKLKRILKSFPITMWIIQKLYENDTGNQCALSYINTNAWQIKRKKKKTCGGDGEGNDDKISMLRTEHGG